jgi:hypothetical protein
MVDEITGTREFETSLVQPLYIGPQGAELILNSFKNQLSVEEFFLTSTVVFCTIKNRKTFKGLIFH